MTEFTRDHKDGIVLAIKPEGMGSAALVGHLKREAGLKKAGHAGTLDRFATGLMILFTGKATPLADFFLHKDKEYIARLSFGKFTDTHDPEGNVVDSKSLSEAREFISNHVSLIRSVISAMMQETHQIPPDYSALKREGKRVSDLVRRGREVRLESRPVSIYEAELLALDPDECSVSARFRVSSGTYIRAIARDISKALDFPLHLSGLKRTSIDCYSIQHPHIWVPDQNQPQILNPVELLTGWKRFSITEKKDLDWISHGRKPDSIELPSPDENFFLVGSDGWPLAWCVSTADGFEYRRVF